ncbi:MAG TPA: polysaccharide biosynthesis tyrosine autokinase [Chitinophagaceae bacterium]|nr:polysaccharide biosynthesis tyrosine autokinase [Chitinophagaceae bacterium]
MPSTTVIEEQYTTDKTELGSLGVKDLLFKYIRFLPVFILSLALALFGSYVYLRYATPIYRASGSLRIKNEKQSGGSNDERLNQLALNSGIQNIQNEIEVLKSKPLVERVVNALNLQVSYNAIGKIKSPNIYKQGPFLLQIFQLTDSSKPFSLNIRFLNNNSFTINGENGTFSFGELFRNGFGVFRLNKNSYGSIGKEYTISWAPTPQVTSELAANIQITPKTGTDILVISLERTNPQMASDIINQLMIEYGELTKEDKSAEASLVLQFVDKSLRSVQHEIDSIQREKTNYEKEYNLIGLEDQTQNYFTNITEAEKGINDQVILLDVTGLIEKYLQDKQNNYETVPSSLGLKDITLENKIQEYNKAQLYRKSLVDSHIPLNNPVVKEQDEIIEKLRADILEAMRNIKTSTNLALSNYRRRGNLAEGQVKSLPPRIKKLREFETALNSKMGIYTYLMEKKLTTTISQASTLSNSKIIEKAYPSSTPVKPNKRSIQLLAILIGLGLPGLFIFLLEVINDKVTTRYDIEKITQAPVLGEVGHSYADNALIVNKTNRGMVAEQFRIIRSNLQYVLNKIDKPVILVTSSFSGEGKSFITTNLGAVMALANKKTIVIEFDIRKPKILTGLGISKRPGVTNYLLGKAEIEDLPVLVPGYDNLFVLSCGPVPPNPSELLLESKVDELFSYLKQNFDVVLIDTAPVGMVSDAMTLGKFANCSLYIVRQGHTYKKQIALIDEFYREAKLPKVSVIINDVKVKPGYGYYGYGRYGYGYGYKSNYYEEEHPPQNIFTRFFGLFDLKNRKNGRSKVS